MAGWTGREYCRSCNHPCHNPPLLPPPTPCTHTPPSPLRPQSVRGSTSPIGCEREMGISRERMIVIPGRRAENRPASTPLRLAGGRRTRPCPARAGSGPARASSGPARLEGTAGPRPCYCDSDSCENGASHACPTESRRPQPARARAYMPGRAAARGARRAHSPWDWLGGCSGPAWGPGPGEITVAALRAGSGCRRVM